MKITVKELAEKLGCAWEGDGSVEISGVASIEGAGPGDLVFADKPKFIAKLAASKAAAAILPPDAPAPPQASPSSGRPAPSSPSPAPSSSSLSPIGRSRASTRRP